MLMSLNPQVEKSAILRISWPRASHGHTRAAFIRLIDEKTIHTGTDETHHLFGRRQRPIVFIEQSIRLKQHLEDLKNYLGQAAALGRQYRAARDKGDWRTARKHALHLIEDYRLSEVAKRCELPVQLGSRPSGAEIYQGNKPVRVLMNGSQSTVKTPAVVYCPNKAKVEFEFRLKGFATARLSVEPSKNKTKLLVLSPTPWVFRFGEPATTACGTGHDRLVVGLRGGKVGIARLKTSQKAVGTLEGGLSEVAGMPSITSTRVIFLNNLGRVVSHSLGNADPAWQVTTKHQLIYDPVVERSGF